MSIFTKKKLVDFVIYGLGQVINLASPLLVMPLILLYCDEEGLGKVGVGFSMAMILNGIVDYGSYINGVKDISVNRENKDFLENKFKAIYLSKAILLIIVIVISTISILSIPYLFKEKTVYFYSLSIVLGQFINPAWYFQGVENFKVITYINILSKTIYLVLVFLIVDSKQDYIYPNLFFGIGAIVANTIGLFWLIIKNSYSIGSVNFKHAFLILKQEFSFSISQFFLSIYQFSPIILISYLLGDNLAGQFKIIDQIVSIFKTYLNMFFYFVYSNICFEINKNLKNGVKIWKQYNLLNFCFLLLLLAVFFINTSLVLTFFKVNANEVAILSYYFKIGLTIPLLVAISQPLRQLMFAFDKNKIYILIAIVSSIFNFMLMTVLIKSINMIGTFISIIIVELLIIVSYSYILRNELKYKMSFIK